MTIEKILNGDSATVAIVGRLDTQTAPELEKELDTFISGLKALTFDMKGLEYISSAGLRVILKAQKIMNTKEDKGYGNFAYPRTISLRGKK